MSDPIVKSIPLSQIVPSRHQARKAIDEVSLKGLAESITVCRDRSLAQRKDWCQTHS